MNKKIVINLEDFEYEILEKCLIITQQDISNFVANAIIEKAQKIFEYGKENMNVTHKNR